MRFKAEFLQKFETWGDLGGSISEPFGINRCKKSECLKTGTQGDLRRDGPESVAPLKRAKKQDISTATGIDQTRPRVPSGTVPDLV